jgi:hypothetical protein
LRGFESWSNHLPATKNTTHPITTTITIMVSPLLAPSSSSSRVQQQQQQQQGVRLAQVPAVKMMLITVMMT